MPFPRQLAPTADKSDLTAWLTEWSLFYPFDYDDQLPAASGSFGLAALRSIVSWKSEKRFKASNDVKIVNYNTVNPGLIVAITGAALAAATDGAALAALLGMVISFFYLLMFMLAGPSRSAGNFMFTFLSWYTLLTTLLAGIFLASDSLSEERREGTLGLLFLTDLKSYDIVLGKFMAVSLNAFYGLLAVFPVLRFWRAE